MKTQDRRQFLKFMGQTGVALTVSHSTTTWAKKKTGPEKHLGFKPILPTKKDDVVLPAGFKYDVFIAWDTPINKTETFGYNNDYIAFLPGKNANEARLWVNHESVHPALFSGYKKGQKKTKAIVDRERKHVGGSLIHIVRKDSNSPWQFSGPNSRNFRVDATTKIPLISERPIDGSKTAIGTAGNCAGGVTPWGTVLTCEENYDSYYGDYEYDAKGRGTKVAGVHKYQWYDFVDHSPEHYGWVVEVNPDNKQAKKLTALGRFAHECATVVKGKDGRCVVYMADDKNDECVYKFIADKPDSLEAGQLYVANTEAGRWLPLDRRANKKLKTKFKDQTELLIRTREAARIAGASFLDRPEDIAVDPKTGHVFVTLTNNMAKKNYHGSILKIVEKNNNPYAMTFTAKTYLPGGPKTGFAAPDNITFDRKGNLWMATDISGSYMPKAPYRQFKNNGLFYIPLRGPLAGQAFQVASAPKQAEFTGICFSADGKTLFVSVQHPGERTTDQKKPTSHWPEGGKSSPHPAVIAITGNALNKLTQG